jgi:hypothetical protein
MSFVHNISTRSVLKWFIGVIFTLLGVPVFFIFGVIGIIYSGIGFNILALVIGLLFLVVGLSQIHAIIRPRKYTRIVSDDMIICKTNGVITQQFNKENIKTIHINHGENDSVDIEMKNNTTIQLPDDYLMSIRSFSQELMMCRYQVNEN